jgi:hypothetical protein
MRESADARRRQAGLDRQGMMNTAIERQLAVAANARRDKLDFMRQEAADKQASEQKRQFDADQKRLIEQEGARIKLERDKIDFMRAKSDAEPEDDMAWLDEVDADLGALPQVPTDPTDDEATKTRMREILGTPTSEGWRDFYRRLAQQHDATIAKLGGELHLTDSEEVELNNARRIRESIKESLEGYEAFLKDVNTKKAKHAKNVADYNRDVVPRKKLLEEFTRVGSPETMLATRKAEIAGFERKIKRLDASKDAVDPKEWPAIDKRIDELEAKITALEEESRQVVTMRAEFDTRARQKKRKG